MLLVVFFVGLCLLICVCYDCYACGSLCFVVCCLNCYFLSICYIGVGCLFAIGFGYVLNRFGWIDWRGLLVGGLLLCWFLV